MAGICVESVLLGLKSCSDTRPSVNFSTPPKRAKKTVPPPPSPPPLIRALEVGTVKKRIRLPLQMICWSLQVS